MGPPKILTSFCTEVIASIESNLSKDIHFDFSLDFRKFLFATYAYVYALMKFVFEFLDLWIFLQAVTIRDHQGSSTLTPMALPMLQVGSWLQRISPLKRSTKQPKISPRQIKLEKAGLERCIKGGSRMDPSLL